MYRKKTNIKAIFLWKIIYIYREQKIINDAMLSPSDATHLININLNITPIISLSTKIA